VLTNLDSFCFIVKINEQNIEVLLIFSDLSP